MRRLRRGGNAIEFALIAPVLFAILGGTMEYGWFLMNQILLDSACREGARTGARTHPDDNQFDAAMLRAEEYWEALGLPGSPTFEVRWMNPPITGHDMLVVTGSLPYPGLIGWFSATPPQVSAMVVVRSETTN